MQPEAAARQRRVTCALQRERKPNKWRYCGTDFNVWPLRSIRKDEGVDSPRSAYFLEARSK
jgi:hypothetical protein